MCNHVTEKVGTGSRHVSRYTSRSHTDLTLDERESILAILTAIALMRRSITSVAAVL